MALTQGRKKSLLRMSSQILQEMCVCVFFQNLSSYLTYKEANPLSRIPGISHYIPSECEWTWD